MLRHWLIQGFDGQRKIYEQRFALQAFGEKQIEALLRVLAAKAGLTFDEIAGAYARRGTSTANDLLRVHRDNETRSIVCGDNPHFIASVRQS